MLADQNIRPEDFDTKEDALEALQESREIMKGLVRMVGQLGSELNLFLSNQPDAQANAPLVLRNEPATMMSPRQARLQSPRSPSLGQRHSLCGVDCQGSSPRGIEGLMQGAGTEPEMQQKVMQLIDIRSSEQRNAAGIARVLKRALSSRMSPTAKAILKTHGIRSGDTAKLSKSDSVVQLPTIMRDFVALCEKEPVRQASEKLRASENRLIDDMLREQAPSDEVREEMLQAIEALETCLRDEIEDILAVQRGVGPLQQLWDIMTVSDNRFYTAYSGVHHAFRDVSESDYQEFLQTADALSDQVKLHRRVAQQNTRDATQLLIEGHKCQTHFAALLGRLMNEGCDGTLGPLKKLDRMVEKTMLRPENMLKPMHALHKGAMKADLNFEKICDICRGFVEGHSMGSLLQVLKELGAEQEAGNIVIVRVKNRFASPSAAGWADCMVNLYFPNDPAAHVCELQLVHHDLMTVRQNLGAHQVYRKGRNATELLAFAVEGSTLGAIVPLIALKTHLDFRQKNNTDGTNAGTETEPNPTDEVAGDGQMEDPRVAGWLEDSVPSKWVNVVLDEAGEVNVLGTLLKALGGFDEEAFSVALSLGLPCKHIDLRAYRHLVNDDMLTIIGAFCSEVKSVDLDTCSNITDEGLRGLAGCSKLRSIKLDFCFKVTSEGVAALLRGCPQLQPDCILPVGCDFKTGAFFAALAESRPKLRSLVLAGCRLVTDACLSVVADTCTLIEHVDVSMCAKLSNAGVLSLLGKCHVLSSVKLRNCGKLTDPCFEAINEKCPFLAVLDVAYLRITNQTLQAIAECEKLTDLDFSGCNQVTDEGLAFLAAKPRLLNRVSLLFLKSISDDGLASVVRACPMLRPCSLESLCKGDAFLAAVADMHKDVQSISLSQCSGVTDVGIRALCLGCGPALQTMQLVNCHRLTDYSIGSISENCPLLKHLDLEHCSKITDIALTSLGCLCGKLENLSLAQCGKIKDAGIKALVRGCTLLKNLNLQRCDRITDDALAEISSHCPGLVSLNLSFCPNITDGGVATLAGGISGLSEIFLESTQVTDHGEMVLRSKIGSAISIIRAF